MKKIIHLLALLLPASLAFAQHPKNGNFETFDGVIPAYWEHVPNSGTVAADAGYGSPSSVSLVSADDGLGFFVGGAITQTDTMSFRPFSISGYRKGTGELTIHVFDGGHNEIGSVHNSFDHAAWQFFEDTIQYTGSTGTYYVEILLENVPITGPTSCYFDTLVLEPTLFSAIEKQADLHPTRFFPNPTSNFLNYKWEEGGSILLYDMKGELLIQQETQSTGMIDVSPYRGQMLLVSFKQGNMMTRGEPLLVQ